MSVGNQDDDNSDEEDEIDFTSNSVDDTNNVVSNALNDPTIAANDSLPPASDSTTDSLTIEEDALEEGHLQGEPNNARSEGSMSEPDPVRARHLPLLSGYHIDNLLITFRTLKTPSTQSSWGARTRQRAKWPSLLA